MHLFDVSLELLIIEPNYSNPDEDSKCRRRIKLDLKHHHTKIGYVSVKIDSSLSRLLILKNLFIFEQTALKAQLLKPEMDCYKGHSHIHCMQAIRAGTADVSVFDASDVYTAGLNYDLIPFISEVYNLDDAEYYVVAVGKESDPSTELTYLKGW